MRKLLSISCIACMVALAIQPSQAQVKFALGPKAGINLANLSLDPDVPSGVDQKMLLGFMFGAAAEIGINDMFAVQAEPMYAMRGSKFESGGQEGELKFSYLEVPILAKLKFGQGNTTPYVLAGPNVGFNLSAEAEGGGLTVDIKESIESVDFGLDFGAGVAVALSPNAVLNIDGRYSLGLSDAYKSSAEAKHTGIQVLVSVLFLLGR